MSILPEFSGYKKFVFIFTFKVTSSVLCKFFTTLLSFKILINKKVSSTSKHFWGCHQVSEASKSASKFKIIASIRHTPHGRSVPNQNKRNQIFQKSAKKRKKFVKRKCWRNTLVTLFMSASLWLWGPLAVVFLPVPAWISCSAVGNFTSGEIACAQC